MFAKNLTPARLSFGLNLKRLMECVNTPTMSKAKICNKYRKHWKNWVFEKSPFWLYNFIFGPKFDMWVRDISGFLKRCLLFCPKNTELEKRASMFPVIDTNLWSKDSFLGKKAKFRSHSKCFKFAIFSIQTVRTT